MNRITREEALDIARNNIGSLFHIEITDKWNAGWQVYAADRLKMHDFKSSSMILFPQ